MHRLKRLQKPLTVLLLCLIAFTAVLEAPMFHRAWLRHKVASRVFEVKGTKDGGGGTGFQIEAPSGEQYIVTNSHVCEYALKDAGSKNILLVQRGEHLMKRRVMEISDRADLCLIEGWPGMSGLKLGGSSEVGDLVIAIGHPLLGPTTMTVGEVTAFSKVSIPHHIMKSGNAKRDKMFNASDESCDQPKNEIKNQQLFLFGVIPLGEVKMCWVNEEMAMHTNATIYPGNSGSPLVDKWGRVVGVVFAADQRSHYGSAVNIDALKFFLADF